MNIMLENAFFEESQKNDLRPCSEPSETEKAKVVAENKNPQFLSDKIKHEAVKTRLNIK